MKKSNKVVAVSLILSSMFALSSCSTGDASSEPSGSYNLYGFKTSDEPYGDERTIFQLEELANQSIQVITSENYMALNPLYGLPDEKLFEQDISKENQEIINSLISKDAHYEEDEESNSDSEAVDMYKFGAKAGIFNSFVKSYLPIPDKAKNLKGLHAVVDSDSYWSGTSSIHSPTTAGAIAVLDGQDRYVSVSGSHAQPLTSQDEKIQISSPHANQGIEENYPHLYNEMINVTRAIYLWSENQSEKKNMDLKKFENSIFESYAPANGIKSEIKGDIASFEIKVSDKQGNVLSYRNLANIDPRNSTSGMTLYIKDEYDISKSLPYELIYEFDHEIAVASYGGKDTTIKKIVENMNSNDKLTGFDWSIEGDNPKDLTIVAESKKHGEYKFTNRLDYPVNPVE